MSGKATTSEGYIDPARLYRRGHALRCLGLGLNTIRTARKAGIHLATMTIGQQLLVRGSDVIAFCEKLAEQKTEGEA